MFTGFADESHIEAAHDWYGLGCLVVPDTQLEDLTDAFESLRGKHRYRGEMKWTKVKKGHGLMNCALAMLDAVMRRGCFMTIMAVHKPSYQKWKGGRARETAFWKTYSLLVQDLARKCRADFRVYIDDRSDRYRKHNESLRIITNRMLRVNGERPNVAGIAKSDSKKLPLIQFTDIMTGAVAAMHNDPEGRDLHPGKRLLAGRLAEKLSLPRLDADTFPSEAVNIWRFPGERRSAWHEKERRRVKLNPDVRFVSRRELELCLSSQTS